MAIRPGVEVLTRDTAPPRSAPTDTSVWFVAGMTEKGSHTAATLITSLDAYTSTYGARVSYGFLYDALETFFREGGSRAYVSRVVGPSPVLATLNLAGTSGTALVVNAKSTGVWANGAAGGLKVQVTQGPVGGAGFRQLLITLNDVLVETSTEFNANADAITWSASSSYVNIVLGGGSGLAVVAAAASLASGTDDHANATDATWETALGLFGIGLGPGQVSQPGRTTVQAHTDVLEHADARNRFAVLDAPDSATKATVAAAADALDGLTTARKGALFAPWVTIAGTAGGTTRTVPPSAVVAGRIAATDVVAGAGQPAAGEFGVSVAALDVTQTYSDADIQELEAPDESSVTRGAVNLLRVLNEQVLVYGFRTVVVKPSVPNWWQATWPRLEMSIKAQAGVIGDQFIFRQIDGKGHTIAAFGGALDGMLNRYYQQGALFGDPDDDRPQTAYFVDVGSATNTEESLADGVLKAVLQVRMSPFAEVVRIEISKVLPNQAIAA